MNKKNKGKSTPADDLIESLLGDVKSSDVEDLNDEYSSQEKSQSYTTAEPSLAGIAMPGIGASDDDAAPIGLAVEEEKVNTFHPGQLKGEKADRFWNQAQEELDTDLRIPDIDEVSRYKGPSVQTGAYQNLDELYNPQSPAGNFEPQNSPPPTPKASASPKANAPVAPRIPSSVPSMTESKAYDSTKVAADLSELMMSGLSDDQSGMVPPPIGGGSGDGNDSGGDGNDPQRKKNRFVPGEPKTPRDEKTQALIDSRNENSNTRSEATDAEKTIAVTAFAQRKKNPSEEKVIVGNLRPSQKQGHVHTSVDASLAQAENLKIAQGRILELEKEIERLRQENEELATAGDIIRQKSEEVNAKMIGIEREKLEVQESLEGEILLLKGSVQFKDVELAKSKNKIEELEHRIKHDFKKIRVRERELENRLDLAVAEKQALVRAKDENILELQRKLDHIKGELDTYKSKVLELNKTIDGYQEQIRRTVRALRLALTSLEVKDENVTPLKKAE